MNLSDALDGIDLAGHHDVNGFHRIPLTSVRWCVRLLIVVDRALREVAIFNRRHFPLARHSGQSRY